MNVRIQLCLLVACLAGWTACGSPGAPMPPSLELPRPADDLAVSRKGSKVTLSWTVATRTTDRQNVRFKKLGPTLICRGANEYPMARCSPLADDVKPVPLPIPPKGQKTAPVPPRIVHSDNLPADLQQMYPTGFVTYAVEAMNWRWRSAGLSNQVKIPLAPTLPPPPTQKVSVTAEGIVIRFECAGHAPANPALRFSCRVYRQQEGAAPVMVASVNHNGCRSAGAAECQVVDHGFEWEQTYRYWVTSATEVFDKNKKVAEVEGDDSDHSAPILAHDIFPPEVPAGLEAVASGVGQKPFVDLSWTPVTAADLAGYNIYRQEPGSPTWTKINREPVTTPAFRDENVAAGRTYTYAVTATDVRNNESARGQSASESVP